MSDESTSTDADADAPSGPRTLPPRRQFDFWVGEWDVFRPDGERAGTNTIERLLDGNLLLERWVGANGVTGMSVNYYDPGSEQWTQTWVDETGGVISMTGTFRDDAMRMSGTHTLADGTTFPYRATFTPQTDGTVDQYLEQSPDGGETFDEWFHGTYVRMDSSRES